MDAYVAQGASLEFCCLVVKSGCIPHQGSSAKGHGVAFQAEQVNLAALEHARVLRAMGQVATGAALGPLRRMLKDKRSGFLYMAFQAG